MSVRISVDHISKEFFYRPDRSSSLKTVLVDLLKGKSFFSSKVRVDVFRDVTFQVRTGEFVGIMGRNGAGKSTLFKILSGIYRPTTGSVSVHARITPLIELGAGFHPDLSGYENIFLNAAILGFGRDAALKAFDEILAFAELGDMIHMPVRNYSSGMLVRLGFAIGTHLPCEILLIDEVLAVGDVKFQAKCLNRIKELHAQGVSILLVTHDPNAVRAHCQRSIIFGNHGVLFDGDPAQGVEVYLKSL